MTWFEGLVAFIIIWWLVIFVVLPWGVKPPARVQTGHASGAPENPRLWRKAAITTVISAALWLVLFVVAEFGLISFRPPQ